MNDQIILKYLFTKQERLFEKREKQWDLWLEENGKDLDEPTRDKCKGARWSWKISYH